MSKYLLAIFILLFSCVSFSQAEQGSAQFMTYGDLLSALEDTAKNNLEQSESLKQEFINLQKSHGIDDSEAVYREFVRIKLAFEATRDSGLWQLRWDVTNKEPNSDSIWSQWHQISDPTYLSEKDAESTAVAECDELSALFAFVSRGLGVKNVGLFWPTWNHTVAVWTTKDTSGNPVRVVVPTSQIFLSADATLGTNEFDPYRQKSIYRYGRKDTSENYKIPLKLAEMMIRQVQVVWRQVA